MKVPKLLKKLLLGQFILFSCFSILVLLISNWYLQRQLVFKSQQQGIMISRQIAHLSEQLLVGKDKPVQALVDEFSKIEGVAYILVTNESENIIAHTFNSTIPAALTTLIQNTPAAGAKEEVHLAEMSLPNIGKVNDIAFSTPSGVFGHIHIGTGHHFITHQVWTMLMWQIGMIVTLLLASVVTSYGLILINLSKMSSQPLKGLPITEGEEQFALVADQIPVPIILSRFTDDRIVYANKSAASALESTPTQLREHHLTEFYQDSTLRPQLWQQIQQQGHLFNYDLAMTTLDQQSKWFTMFLQLVNFGQSPPVILNVFYDITSRKQTEEELLNFTNALQANEKKYCALFDSAHDAIFIIDGYRLIDFNSSTLSLFNYTVEELVEKTPYALSPPTQLDGSHSEVKAKAKIEAALAGTPQLFEWVHQRKDGSLFYAKVSLNAIDLVGRRCVQAIVRDITQERQHAEAEQLRFTHELQKSEERFQVIAQTTPIPVMITRTTDNEIVYANEQASVTFGVLTTELIGRYTKEFFLTLEDWQDFANFLVRDGFMYDYEVQMKKIDGTPLWASWFSQPTLFNNESVMVNTIYDITARKQSEEEKLQFIKELQETEERFRVIAETTPIPVVITQTDNGLILYANQRTRKVFGLSVEELVNKHRTSDFYAEPNEREKLLITVKQSGAVENYEMQLRQPNNTLVWVSLFVQPLLFKKKKALLTAIYDITERKQAEEERLRYINELASLNTMLTRLNTAYERFVPYEFLQLLGKENVIDVHLGDQVERNMTILFSDIRGFTSLSEKMTPQENFSFINSYLSQMAPIISEHQGFIDKYIGDAIMALFATNADDAVRCAIAMLKRLEQYNWSRQPLTLPMISIGIGLNTGPLMLGTVGDENRMEGTVISDSVNLASRVEGLNKIYGTTLLITEYTYQQLIDLSQYKIRVIDRVTVKGKTRSVIVYEVFDADNAVSVELKLATLSDFQTGFQYYHQGNFRVAKVLFEKVLKTNPSDKVAQVYLMQCQSKLNLGEIV